QDYNLGILRFDTKTNSFVKVFDDAPFREGVIKGIWPSEDANTLYFFLENGLVYTGNLQSGTIQYIADIFEGKPQDQLVYTLKKDDTFLLASLSSKIHVFHQDGYTVTPPLAF